MTFKLREMISVLAIVLLLILVGSLTSFADNMSNSVAEETILGDANADGSVTISDVTCIQRKLAELPLDSSYSALAADVNGNDEIDIADATLIQMWLVEAETSYPIGEPIDLPVETTCEPTTEAPTASPTDDEGWGHYIFQP